VISLWIGSNGYAMNGNKIGMTLKKVLRQWNPEIKGLYLMFRRMSVSMALEKYRQLEKEKADILIKNMETLLNVKTGVMTLYYDRNEYHNQTRSALQEINSGIIKDDLEKVSV
jgi:hypothetical protein